MYNFWNIGNLYIIHLYIHINIYAHIYVYTDTWDTFVSKAITWKRYHRNCMLTSNRGWYQNHIVDQLCPMKYHHCVPMKSP